MHLDFKPRGVCSRNISIDVEDGIVKSAAFTGGCPGNTIGVAKLVEGKSVEEVISLLDGIKCGDKPSSCPEQLAAALKEISK